MVQNNTEFGGDNINNSVEAKNDEAAANRLVELMQLVQVGDRSAFTQFYQLTSAKVFGILLQIIRQRETAEEILQEVYIKVWRKAGLFQREKSSVITWLCVIARNHAIDHLRKRQAPQEEDEESINRAADNAPTPSESFEIRRDLERLEFCLTEVGEPQAEMVRHAYLHGASRQELAARYSQPLGTIKTWLHRSLKHLKSCLGNAEGSKS